MGDYNKYPIGTAILIFPFFLVAHVIASLFMPAAATGYTPVYQYAVAFAALFYYCIGIIFIYMILKRSFHRMTVLITLIAITYGTMLPVYATQSASFSHVFAFAVNTIFCYLVMSGNDGTEINGLEYKKSLILGVSLAFVCLIRNTNGILAFMYLLYGFGSIGYRERIRIIFQPKRIFFNTIGFTLPLIPQLLYWKIKTGSIFVNSYSGETFQFARNPKIYEVLFSDSKGLLIFCPILIFSFLGLFYGKRNSELEKVKVASVIIFLLDLYIYAAWWCWWLGAAYGLRSFCDILCIFAIGIAIFVEHVFYDDFISERLLVSRTFRIIICAIGTIFIFNSQAFICGTEEGVVNNGLAGWKELNAALRYYYTGEDIHREHWWSISDGENKFIVADSYFKSMFEQEEGSAYVSQGAGWLLYGPYKEIPEGQYTITFVYQFSGEVPKDGIIGYVNVNSNEGAFDSASHATKISATSTIATIEDLAIDQPCRDFEVQVYAACAGLKIKEIIIMKE